MEEKMKIEKFEDINSWKEARKLTSKIYKTSGTGAFAKDWGLRDQIRRASVSVMSNIAEGFDYQSDRQFMRFLAIAFSSASEVQSHLYVALDQNYIDQTVFKELYDLCVTCKNLIYGFRKYLAQNK